MTHALLAIGLILTLASPGRAQEGPAVRLLQQAKALLAQGEVPSALPILERAVREAPKSAEAWTLLGEVSWRLGGIGVAKQAWAEAAELDPDRARLLRWRLMRLDEMTRVLARLRSDEPRLGPLAEKALARFMTERGFVSVESVPEKVWAGVEIAAWRHDPTALKALAKAGPADLLFLGVIRRGERLQLEVQAIDLKAGKLLGRGVHSHQIPAPEELTATVSALGRDVARTLVDQTLVPRLLRADLTIDSKEIIFPKTTLLEGVPISVGMTVQNRGDAAAQDFAVRVWEVRGGKKSTSLKNFQVAAAPPLSSVVLAFPWVPKGPGLHTVTIVIDPDGRVLEGDRSNNTTSRTILVLSEAQARLNLYAFAMDYVPPEAPAYRILEAEREVLRAASDPKAVERLVQVAVSGERQVVSVVGVGLRPWYVLSDTVALARARQAALVDAQRWLSLIQEWVTGYHSDEVFGATIMAEQGLPDGSYLVQMRSPLQ